MLILAFAAASAGVISSETIVKNSSPFSFPLTVGVIKNMQPVAGHASFISACRGACGKFIELSWSLAGIQEKGTITVFSLNGATIRSFPINLSSGSIRWNIADGRLAKGIYLVKLSSASVNKNHKLMIY